MTWTTPRARRPARPRTPRPPARAPALAAWTAALTSRVAHRARTAATEARDRCAPHHRTRIASAPRDLPRPHALRWAPPQGEPARLAVGVPLPRHRGRVSARSPRAHLMRAVFRARTPL